jgi:polysaccharide biosynthesis/export protein
LRLARLIGTHGTCPLRWGTVLACGMVTLGLLTGCETKSFIDPGEMGRYEHTKLTLPVLNRVDPGIEEPNDHFVYATEPTAEDLQPTSGDYTVSKNDLLTIEIPELQAPGATTIKQTRVTESGNITLPFIGQIHAEGLTEAELENAINEEYRRQNILNKPQVTVTTTEARGRAFDIQGAVQQPNQYVIYEPDFRLLNALTVAHDVTSPLLTEAYIIRRTDLYRSGATTSQPAAPRTGTGTGTTPRTAPEELAPRGDAGNSGMNPALASRLAPRGRDAMHLVMQAGDVAPSAAAAPGTATRPAAAPGSRVFSNPSAAPATAAPATTPAGSPGPGYIMVQGKPYYIGPATQPAGTAAPARTTGGTAAVAPGAAAGTGASGSAAVRADATVGAGRPTTMASGAAMRAGGTSGGFEFNDLPMPDNIRIIHIPLDKLKNGDVRYNVVIRPKDVIIVPLLPQGEYFMGGHVARPGAYQITGNPITLKQAVIAASMLDQLAIPERTDVIRELGPGREVFVRVNLAKIFAGQQSDIYLKPGDQVMVGTNALAPFLAAIRGSFRFTYGFGFLYDRNFAAAENNRIAGSGG